MNRELAERVLAERRRRLDAAANQNANVEFAARLRAFYHPKQAGFYRSRANKKATKKTRRSGATVGGCREFLARAVELPGFRAVYATTTLQEAKSRAWKNDTNSGLVDVIEQEGVRISESASGPQVYRCGAVEVTVREGDLELIFDNGSKIELFGANHEQATTKLKGIAKDVYWIDEAQDFTWLERFYKATICAGTADFAGEVWLTGTPSEDCAGFFFEVTRDDDPAKRIPGWEVHELTVTDNPFFGRIMDIDGERFVVDNLYGSPKVPPEEQNAHRYGPYPTLEEAEAKVIEVRWERAAGNIIRENAWEPDDPDLLRDWYARWVQSDARYVYDAHKVTEHELCYAPMRIAEDGLPDIATAVLDLPGWKDGREYILGVGADLGTTRAFAWVLVAWSMLDPVLYEVACWKRTGLDYDQMADSLRTVQAGANVGMWVADAGGGGKPAVKGWSRKWAEQYRLPIIEAEKVNKITAIRSLNTDIRNRRFRTRIGSPLLTEWKSHRWLPLRAGDGKLVEDPATLRDLCDAALYIHRMTYHYRWREADKKVETNSPEWVMREEAELLHGAAQDAPY